MVKIDLKEMRKPMSVVYCKVPSNDIECEDPAGKPKRKDDEMENYVMFKGVKIPITDEQMKELVHGNTISLSIKKSDIFKRIADNPYYAISSYGEVLSTFDLGNERDDLHYATGNYCRDEEILQQQALHETLNRLLWRFSIKNGEDENPWDGDSGHYAIYATDELEFCAYCEKIMKSQGVIYFPSIEIAKQAIIEIIMTYMKKHTDFVW